MVRYGMKPSKAMEVFTQNKENKLKKVRVSRGLSQVELSRVSGIAKQTIQGYERTRVKNIRFETLCNLCLALNCKITDIVDDKELIEKFNKCK